MLTGTTNRAVAQLVPPIPNVPFGENAPGAWPFGVSGANFDIRPIPGSVLGGSGSDNLSISLAGFGPIKWTESRHNEGDIAIVLGPDDPSSVSDPPAGFFDNYQPTSGPTTHAWRINRDVGIPLSTVRVNGRDNGDFTSGGLSVGTFYPTTNFSSGFGQGQSYNMLTGQYTNGGGGATDLLIGFAGLPDEASADVGAAFFPYSEGWLGGFIDSTAIGPNGEASWEGNSRSPSLAAAPPVVWQADAFGGGKARVTLPDHRPATGMLFVSSTDDDSDLKIAAAHPRDGGWDVALRDNSDFDVSGQTLASTSGGNADFSFLYIDYSTPGLIGGHVDSAGDVIDRGAQTFDIQRTSTGQYELTVPGKTDSDGMLILSNAGVSDTDKDLAGRAFLSYEYNDATGKFVIQSREAVIIGPSPIPAGGSFPLRDTDFYFAWVDFSDPLHLGLPSDLTGNGFVDFEDLTVLLANWNKDVTAAEGNLVDPDGTPVNFDDLTVLLAAWTGPGPAGAAIAGENGAAVPEPTTILLALCGLLGGMLTFRRRAIGERRSASHRA